MGRFDAGSDSTQVINMEADRYSTNPLLVSNAMDNARLPGNADFAVAGAIQNAAPDQASALSLRVRKESVRYSSDISTNRKVAVAMLMLAPTVSITQGPIPRVTTAILTRHGYKGITWS